MAGVFPINGVPAVQTINGDFDVETVEGCDPLFYRANCVPQFDAIAMNAMISEFVNAVGTLGVNEYDCSKLNNLETTLIRLQHLCRYPEATEAELTDDDTFAGCFSGSSKRIRWEYMKKQIQLDLCELPASTTIADNDTFAGCFGGESKRVAFTRIRDTLLDFCSWTAETDPVGTDSVVGCFSGSRKRLTLTTLKNFILDFCDWEAYPTARATDTLVGCINGARRAMSLETLKEYILRLCELPVVTAANTVPSDSLAGCFGAADPDETGSENGRIRLSELEKLFKVPVPFFRLGGLIENIGGEGELDIGSRTAFVIAVTAIADVDTGTAVFQFGGLGFTGAPNSNLGSLPANLFSNFPLDSPPSPKAYLVMKTQDGWFLYDNGLAWSVEVNGTIIEYDGRGGGGISSPNASARVYNVAPVNL